MSISSPGMVTPASVRTQFKDASEECEVIVRQLDATSFNWKSSPKRWSVAQCIDHLNTSGELVAENLAAAIGGTSPKWLAKALGPLERAFVRSMKPGASMKVPSPGAYQPSSSDIDPVDALERFVNLQTRMASIIDEYEARDNLDRVVRSPATRLLWMSARSWFELTAVHQERHIAQAQRVIRDPHFPTSD
jgi:hypothetical protein